jgi:hypothetical protein
MAGHVVIRITERLGGGEPLRTAYAVAEPNQQRACPGCGTQPSWVALRRMGPNWKVADIIPQPAASLSQDCLNNLPSTLWQAKRVVNRLHGSVGCCWSLLGRR